MTNLTSVKDPDIDRAHQQLAELLQFIIERVVIGQSVQEEMKQLYTKAKNHFSDEEALMEEVEYPFSVAHYQAHADILARIITLETIPVEQLKDLSILFETLLLRLAKHVEHYDVALFKYNEFVLAARQGQGASSSLPS